MEAKTLSESRGDTEENKGRKEIKAQAAFKICYECFLNRSIYKQEVGWFLIVCIEARACMPVCICSHPCLCVCVCVPPMSVFVCSNFWSDTTQSHRDFLSYYWPRHMCTHCHGSRSRKYAVDGDINKPSGSLAVAYFSSKQNGPE